MVQNEGCYYFRFSLDLTTGRLMTPRKVVNDRVVELHYERSQDFGQEVQCFAANIAGADSHREKIPCESLK